MSKTELVLDILYAVVIAGFVGVFVWYLREDLALERDKLALDERALELVPELTAIKRLRPRSPRKGDD
jgi:hypothetical protein